MTDFELTDGERTHPLWLRFKDHLLARLATARARNDNPLFTDAETASLRGEIACLKKLIALGDERPAIE